MAKKQYRNGILAGFVAERRNPLTGEDVVIFRAKEQDIDVGPDKYAVVCNAHSTLVGCRTLERARQAMRDVDFCEACMQIALMNKTGTLTWEKCPGEAHENPYIDNCWTCAPFWGKVPRCSCGGSWYHGDLNVTKKHITCRKCGTKYPRPE